MTNESDTPIKKLENALRKAYLAGNYEDEVWAELALKQRRSRNHPKDSAATTQDPNHPEAS